MIAPTMLQKYYRAEIWSRIPQWDKPMLQSRENRFTGA